LPRLPPWFGASENSKSSKEIYSNMMTGEGLDIVWALPYAGGTGITRRHRKVDVIGN
jgi:hypothetical protein